MGKMWAEITDSQQRFITAQKMFFTATAATDGRVNVSPKGLDAFRVITPRRVAYLDLTGSGNETAAHLALVNRITIMFCAFEGNPLILRLYGRGRAVHPRDGDWAQLRPLLGPPIPGERQIIDVTVDSVQTSCGFGVPLMAFEADREILIDWAEKKGDAGVKAYWEEKNTRSIDGFPTHLLGS